MNKDLVNLVLSYFTIKFVDMASYIINNEPILFAMHRCSGSNNNNSIFCLISYNQVRDTYYQNVYNNSVETFITEEDNSIMCITFTNGIEGYYRSSNSTKIEILLANTSDCNAVDLITTFDILKQKYNKILAKMITLAKLTSLLTTNYQSFTLNLLNSYLNLSIEFKILNLKGLPIYFSNEIFVKRGYHRQLNDVIRVNDSRPIDQVKQTLNNLVADVDKMYKQILDAVNKF